jgi:response regulator RpfG family c-di-GMP phosphodiesterase
MKALPAELDPRTVTLVDDEPHALDVLVRAAKSWRYDCQAATSAEQAVEMLERRPTPVVVTDLRMPGRGGVWLVHEIQRRWPETSVIVITAGQEEDAVGECLSAGAQRYFLKPINLDEFKHALASTVRSYRLEYRQRQYRRVLETKVRQRTRQLRRTYLSAIDSLVRTLEARDPYTSGHSMRVREYALKLARGLDLPGRQRRQIGLAAKLHDIGKVGLSEAILNKDGALTETEQAAVREHPVIGERILTPIIRNPAVLRAIRGHHERYDGGGYPDGLAGDALSLETRIITVADCFDAITTSRAYRRALPRAKALAVLQDAAGTQLDPKLVAVFLELM